MSTGGIPIFRPKDKVSAPQLAAGEAESMPFVIVGSGPAGLISALDLARKGHDVVVLTSFDFISEGSKGICYAKQSLDIFNRLGVGEKLVDRGVIWNVGKVFWKDNPEPVYEFDMLPVKGQKNPGFINIQQYYVEDVLVGALEEMDNVHIRWGHTVTDIKVDGDRATLDVEAHDGAYQIDAGYVLACDGNKSFIRNQLGLDFEGRVFEDNFLIADVRLKHDHPNERYFWFDPPFNPGRTALLHKQPDDVWRLDFQLGWDVDREAAIKPENVEPYVRGMLGDDVEFEEVWYSIYTFQCRRMARFVHGPVIFVGDSAHLVSPFGARGANSGMADAENIAWKLDMVLRGEAPASLLESYNYERTMGADENILNSTRSTDFMVPKNAMDKAFQDAALELARQNADLRPYINSGRLSTPTPYHNSPISTADSDDWQAGPAPGYQCTDGMMGDQWLMDMVGDEFVLLSFGGNVPDVDIKTLNLPLNDMTSERYDATADTLYLIRPDNIIAARWKEGTTAEQILAARDRAMGKTLNEAEELNHSHKVSGLPMDNIYQSLKDLHADLDEEDSQKANAKLILLLANHIGNAEVIEQAADLVRNSLKS